jgi:hypothetical protein
MKREEYQFLRAAGLQRSNFLCLRRELIHLEDAHKISTQVPYAVPQIHAGQRWPANIRRVNHEKYIRYEVKPQEQ